MKKIVVLLLALMSFFTFSKNYERKEDKKGTGTSTINLVLIEGSENSYDFSFEYVMLGSMPKLRQLAGTAYKNGDKYIFKVSDGSGLEFSIKNNKVVVSGDFDRLVKGEYIYTSESTSEDSETIEWIKENIMPD